eukprot:TRINITY_DN42266_c0_g2_i4.p1 TRINITY_DN42266_c0_g2~~TRINITY_DN42266_c0_g2_i4.p1  ORF type:complete len:208 (+),score=-3.83 TRINITY_DN42266_c0_g2_i4:448-1071(+)
MFVITTVVESLYVCGVFSMPDLKVLKNMRCGCNAEICSILQSFIQIYLIIFNSYKSFRIQICIALVMYMNFEILSNFGDSFITRAYLIFFSVKLGRLLGQSILLFLQEFVVCLFVGNDGNYGNEKYFRCVIISLRNVILLDSSCFISFFSMYVQAKNTPLFYYTQQNTNIYIMAQFQIYLTQFKSQVDKLFLQRANYINILFSNILK